MTSTPAGLRKINDEVFIAAEEVVRVGDGDVAFITEQALKNQRGRARICAHKSSGDSLHEMLIAMRPDTYIRPHRHRNRAESFHLIDGAADIALFDEQGNVTEVVELAPGRNFFYRLDISRFHTVLINSPVFVVHEVTNGPFDPAQTEFAPFSPEEGDARVPSYISEVRAAARSFSASNNSRK